MAAAASHSLQPFSLFLSLQWDTPQYRINLRPISQQRGQPLSFTRINILYTFSPLFIHPCSSWSILQLYIRPIVLQMHALRLTAAVDEPPWLRNPGAHGRQTCSNFWITKPSYSSLTYFVLTSSLMSNWNLSPIGPRLCACVCARARTSMWVKRGEFRDDALHKFVSRSDWVNLTVSGSREDYYGRDKLSRMATVDGRWVINHD